MQLGRLARCLRHGAPMVRRRVSKPTAFSPALRRLGLATPPPFLGREAELARLDQALGEVAVVAVIGGIGAGKTRLALELVSRRGGRAAYLRCCPGDRAEAIRARAERALGCAPGALDQVLRDEDRLLVVDDIHHVDGGGEAAFAAVTRRPGAGRLVLLGRDAPALPRSGPPHRALELEGLDEAAARDLWSHLEETYGPTRAGSVDSALCRTRGLPLALRREYAEAAYGAEAWSVEELAPAVRRALEVVAVLVEPVAPAGVAALTGDRNVEPALIELVSRQLIDPLADGRFAMHDIVREQVVAGIEPARRAALDRAAAALVLRGARDDGALALPEAIDRLRLAVHHLLAAGDAGAAAALLVERAPARVERGAAGEILGLIEQLREAGAADEALAALGAAIAARRGEVCAALLAGGPADPIEHAELRARAGEIERACEVLGELAAGADRELAARAAAALAEIELDRGAPERARQLVDAALLPDVPRLSGAARARVLLAAAAVDAARGDAAAARLAHGRALAAAGTAPVLAAQVEVARAGCLVTEGRLREAAAVLEEAERAACDADAAGVADEVSLVRARLAAAAGDLLGAAARLEALCRARRGRGDELGALRGELELAAVMERRGELLVAAELAGAVRAEADRLGLAALARRGDEIMARADAAACRAAGEVAGGCERHAIAARAARGESHAALALARAAVVAAERSGNPADLADALAWCARLELAAGDRPAAELAAIRAAREAASCGASWARCAALLVLAALARDAGEVVAASSYARDAAEVAASAGLPVERLVAERALAAIAGPGPVGELSGAAASLGPAGRDAAARALADLGLTAVRPFRLVGADGVESRVSDASPERLQMAGRDLVIDGVREVIVRAGAAVADLRRRSLLKRLLFLFAAEPGRIFSKEEIVQKVWEVEYHPLRHDAALFTNIMRIRRLLGVDGAELIRVSEEGYRFTPGSDFLFVEAVS